MKADQIIKNAKIFTANKDNLLATALVVKDGKFIYVGDEAGLSAYEGEATDLGGKFIMPGVIDTHVHVTTSIGFAYMDPGEYIFCSSKKEALDFMAQSIKNNPGLKRYRFILERKYLNGDDIVKEDLDAICPDAELLILEGEGHSVWVNSKILDRHGITDETPDRVPELSYYVRKDGHVTGNAFESSGWHMLFDDLEVTDEQIDAELLRWIDYSVKAGVTVVFDAGFPEGEALHERIYERLYELDKQGKLPVYIDGSIALTNPLKTKEVVEAVKRFGQKFDSEHLNVWYLENRDGCSGDTIRRYQHERWYHLQQGGDGRGDEAAQRGRTGLPCTYRWRALVPHCTRWRGTGQEGTWRQIPCKSNLCASGNPR